MTKKIPLFMKTWMMLVVLGFGLTVSGWGQVVVDTAAVKAKVDSLYQLAYDMYFKSGNTKKAISLINAHLPLIEKYLSRELRYARSLNLKAICFSTLDIYEKAEQQWLECLEIREKFLTRNHPDCAEVLYNLGLNCNDQGKFEDAEPFLLEAKDIYRLKIEQALVLNALGIVYRSVGRYQESEKMLLESLSIYANNPVENQLDTRLADVLNNLGNLFYTLGNYAEAESYHLKAKSIRKNLFGIYSLDYIQSLSNLSSVYDDWGMSEKAEPLMLEVIKLRRKVLGRNNRNYANDLNNLAALYFYTNRLEQAKTLIMKSQKITKKVLGKNHPNYINRLSNIGVFYRALGRYSKAKKYLTESILMQKKFIGKHHPNYLTGLAALAYVYHQTKDYFLSDSLFKQALHGQQIFITNAVSWQSEEELTATSQIFEENFSGLMSAQFFSHPGLLPTITYDYILFYKGFLLEAAAAIKNRALADTASAKIWQNLALCRRSLAAEYSNPITERDSTSVTRFEQQANDLEKELARRVSGFGEAFKPIGWQDVQQKLHPGEAAIEFVSFKKSFPKPTDSTMYAALVLRPDWEQPLFVPLFEEKQLSAALGDTTLGSKERIEKIYIDATLYDLIIKPLEPYLNGVKTIHFSPSGLLHSIAFAAIPNASRQRLSEYYELRQYNSTRKLVTGQTLYSNAIHTACVYGGIRYDTTPIKYHTCDDSLSIRGALLDYLPCSPIEMRQTHVSLTRKGIKTDTTSGYNATEESIKAKSSGPSPDLLHISTHGAYLPQSATISTSFAQPLFLEMNSPLAHSFIAFAYAKDAYNGKPRPRVEDGLLTAFEITTLDLSGTKLAVLSACETALGDIQGSEGVYGLQRAFKIAGVNHIIVSLWKIEESAATLDFMNTFYQHFFSGLEVRDAFARTQKEMREKHEKPYLWAAFILI